MNKTVIIVGVAILILLGVAGFLFMQSQNMVPQPTPNPETIQQPTDDVSVDMSEEATGSSASSQTNPASGSSSATTNVREFNITAADFKFNPNVISVNKGDKIKISLTSTDGFHDFTLDEFNVQTKSIGKGLSDTVEFTADKVGTFEFYCSIGNHRAMGMKGQLIVK